MTRRANVRFGSSSANIHVDIDEAWLYLKRIPTDDLDAQTTATVFYLDPDATERLAEVLASTYQATDEVITSDTGERIIVDTYDDEYSGAPYVHIAGQNGTYRDHDGRGEEVFLPACAAQYLGLKLREILRAQN